MGQHSIAFIRDGDDVYHSYGANQGLILGRDACLFVDSGFHNRTANELLREARKDSPKKIYLLDTHYHSDHVFGSHPLARAGATVIAHENCRKSMLKNSQALLERYKNRNSRLRKLLEDVIVEYPSLTFKKKLTLHLDDTTTVDIIHPTLHAHTNGDAIAMVREDRVIFAGDIYWNKYHPNLEDANIQGQIEALDMIADMSPKKIVPGHGRASDTSGVKKAAHYLRELERNLSRRDVSGRIIPSWTKGWKMRWLMDEYVKGQRKDEDRT